MRRPSAWFLTARFARDCDCAKRLGQVNANLTADYPIAAAFTKNGETTYIAHNYTEADIIVTFSDGYIIVNKNLSEQLEITDPYFYCPGIVDEEQLSNQDEIRKGPIRLAYTGVLSDYYGVHELVQYAEACHQQYELHICGRYWKSGLVGGAEEASHPKPHWSARRAGQPPVLYS